MRYWNGFSPIVSGFLCGFYLPELTRAIDTGKGVHSASDLLPWILVPAMAIAAVLGGLRAVKLETASKSSS